MPNIVKLPIKLLAPNAPIKGNTVEFPNEIKAQGGVKDVYFSCDKTYVVAFYRKQLDANDKDRLERIVNTYYPRIFDGTPIGEYWREMLYLPCGIVEWDGKLGVIVPFYSKRFFFSGIPADFPFIKNGQEKDGKRFASAKNMNRFVPVNQKGTWLTRLHMCIKISRAVRRLHAAGLAHSDLSYKNVLVDPVTGSACVIDADEVVVPGRYPPGVIGTPDFIAPEVMATKGLKISDPNRRLPRIETDRHALAVLIYMYLLNRHPLRGGKVWDMDSAKDEELTMGAKALFIEHPTDQSNRVKVNQLSKTELPQGDPSRLPYTICGPYLKELFDKAFIDGLHNPAVRPTAQMWEDALVRTADLVQPCQNPNCENHWYVFDNTRKPRCPFCGQEYHGQLPVLNFYYKPRDKYQYEKCRLMVYDGQTLYKWHSNNLVPIGEKTTEDDKKTVGDFHFHNGQWILINRRLPDMYDVTGKKPIGINEFVPLTDGRQILLDKSQGGRLIIVQLVNN